MPTDTEDSGFLSRWSRRKVLVRQGAAVQDVPEPAAAVLPAAAPAQTEVQATATPAASATDAAAPEPPPLTLDDVAALTRESDYSRFVGRGVQPDVKNAALTKLFTDPHFNVMDRLDTYIDDYGKPDPLPPGMLRQMLQAHVLGLFDEEDELKKKNALAEAAPLEEAAAPLETAAAPTTEPSTDENTDLQLQPDHALGCAGLEPGPGQDAGGQHGRVGDGPYPAVPA